MKLKYNELRSFHSSFFTSLHFPYLENKLFKLLLRCKTNPCNENQCVNELSNSNDLPIFSLLYICIFSETFIPIAIVVFLNKMLKILPINQIRFLRHLDHLR